MCCATRVFLVLVSLFFAASCYKSEQEAPPQTPHISTGIFPDWEVVEDVEQMPNLDIAKMKFKSFLKNGESYISGDEMRERAVALKCNLGLSDAEYLLEPSVGNPDRAPWQVHRPARDRPAQFDAQPLRGDPALARRPLGAGLVLARLRLRRLRSARL